MIMKLVTKNRVIIAILLTIIFSILFWRSSLLKQPQEGLTNELKLRLFVINMDKDKERYQKLLKHYKNSDLTRLSINRYEAVVGKKVSPETWLSKDALTDLQLIEKNGFRTHHHSVTRGGLGCFLSHYNLAKQLMNDQSVEGYLIFEDDTTMLPSTYNQITESLENAPKDWDMLLFYTIRAVGRSENENFNKLKSFWGMNCYILSKNGAKKFVKEVDETKIDGQVDCYLSRMIQQKKMNIYSSKTHFVSSNSTDTNIQTLLKPQQNIDPYDYKGYRV
jgi:collagen beta-1,O-galactosyltransferase